jgi:hypothetical protein
MATNLINNVAGPYRAKETTLLNAVTATGAGSTWTPGLMASELSWQITVTGAPSGVSVTLQVSKADDQDGSDNWVTVDTSTTTTSEIRHVSNDPGVHFRANLGTLTGGTSPTVTVTMIAKAPGIL